MAITQGDFPILRPTRSCSCFLALLGPNLGKRFAKRTPIVLIALVKPSRLSSNRIPAYFQGLERKIDSL